MTIAAEIRAKRAALEREIDAMWERHQADIARCAEEYPAERILAAVAAVHELNVKALRGVNRSRRYSYARHHAVWELRRRRLDMTLTDVAALLHRTDHTTALNSYQQFAKAVSRGQYKAERDAVEAMLEAER